MSESAPAVGQISWSDLTVPNADRVRDFYVDVVGWRSSELDMGGYSDYCMNLPSNDKTVAGVCWQRGVNAGLPPVWLVYINVANLDESVRKCTELGGQILRPPTDMGDHGRYSVIRDPAGAVAALFEPRAPAAKA
jgi:predicted enzyme related to lactoylglutathione lyase